MQYFGPNLPRLGEVKARVDPGGFFSPAVGGVPLPGAAQRRRGLSS